MKYFILFFICSFCYLNSFSQLTDAQNESIDSLKLIINNSKHDTIKIKAWSDWDKIIYKSDPNLDKIINDTIYTICSLNLKDKIKPIEKEYYLLKKGEAANNLGIIYYYSGDFENSIFYYKQNLKIQESLNNKDRIAIAINNIGAIYHIKGDLNTSIEYHFKSLKIKKEIKDTLGIASSYGNLGLSYTELGNYQKAIKYFTESLTLSEIIKDTLGIASANGNIGVIYFEQNDLTKSKMHYQKSLKAFEAINYKNGIVRSLNNLGRIYFKEGNTAKALEFQNKCLEINKTLGDKLVISKSYKDIGNIHFDTNDYEKALNNYTKSLNLTREIEYKEGISNSLFLIGKVFYKLNKYNKSLKYLNEAKSISLEINNLLSTQNSSEYLYKNYKVTNQYKSALSNYELFISSRDSLISEKNIKEILNQEYKYTYEKQAAIDSITHLKEKEVLDTNIQKQALEIKQKRIQQLALFGGIGLLLVFGGFMYNRFKVTKKQKGIIEFQKTEVEVQKQEVEEQRDYAKSEHKKAEELRVIAETQKEIVEEKSKEIMDSITYAKRLQNAILPPPRLVKEWLTDSFIFYKPKDIVAGDFYWMEVIKKEGKSIIFYAAADCTGHGVPGAMVSVVCSNALNRSIKEFNITDPAKLLDKVTELVKEAFDKSDEVIKDGMDIAICALDLIDKKVWFSGANNPLYRITNLNTKIEGDFKIMETENRKLVEYKADKQPVGEYEYMKPFTTTEIQLEPGDCLYIFSDGFSDQFGGEKGKKYKSANFKRFLMQIENKEMDVQKEILDTEIERWRGEIEQVDDICVIGLRVNGLMSKIFTKRELEVLKKVLEGKASKNIADELFISKHTVDTHRKRILAKTNAKNVVELTKFCDTHSVF